MHQLVKALRGTQPEVVVTPMFLLCFNSANTNFGWRDNAPAPASAKGELVVPAWQDQLELQVISNIR